MLIKLVKPCKILFVCLTYRHLMSFKNKYINSTNLKLLNYDTKFYNSDSKVIWG